jgi:hypothetical protein
MATRQGCSGDRVSELERDVAAITALLDRYDAETNRRPVTYVDVLHAVGESHRRAGDALAVLESTGAVDWHSNGWVMRRRRTVP